MISWGYGGISSIAAASVDTRFIYVHSNFGDPLLNHKKRALDAGIKNSHSEILLFTDVDCSPPLNWVEQMVSRFTPKTDYVIGYSEIPHSKNLVCIFQKIDFLMLMVATKGSINNNWFWSCSGQNQAYRRKIYRETGGFLTLSNYLQGDDSLFLQVCKNTLNNFRVKFFVDPDNKLFSRKEKKILSFLKQRLRWSGDANIMWNFNPQFYLMILSTFFSNIILLILFCLCMLNHISINNIIFPVICKFIIEYLLFVNAKNIFKLKINLIHFIYWWILQIPYVTIMGLGSFFQKNIIWKDRQAC